MNSALVQDAYTKILKHIIDTGHAPHYSELAAKMGVSPDEARDLQREAAMSDPAGGSWMSHDTDYIEAWSPFSNLPTHHRISVDGKQKWFGVWGLEALAVRWLFPGQEVKIDTTCLDCGETISIRMKDEAILEIDPPTTVGYMMSPFTKWREGSKSFNWSRMNLFRSEEHVKRWSLYYRLAEDYVMPVSDWAKVFSRQLFRSRLDPDYLSREDLLADYHLALKELGKSSPYWQYPFLAQLDVVKLSRYRIVGSYTRYEESVLNALKDARQNILAGVERSGQKRENHLIWAAPGSGKTFFVQEIAKSLQDRCTYVEINLAKADQDEFRASLEAGMDNNRPQLFLIDEIDAKPDAPWPYEILLPFLDAAVEKGSQSIFILAGSSGYSLEGMKERMASRPKGRDLLSRLPTENEYVIPPMSFGDRILVVMSQFVRAGKAIGREIRAVEKLGLYYIALNSKLTNARQLYEFAIRAVERGPRGDERVKYDQLFIPGDPENKRFWLEVSSVAGELVNRYILIEE